MGGLRLRRFGLLFSFALSLILALSPMTLAQTPLLPTPKLELPQINNTDVVTTGIQLDGRELFTIALPATSQPNQPNQKSAIAVRRQSIEATLQRFANQRNASNPQVNSTLDANSNLPIISINQQYLMTVTTLDAQLQGQQPTPYAEELTRIISAALIEAKRERQPDVITQQTGKAIATLGGMFALSWLVSLLQKSLRKRQRLLEHETPHLTDIPPNTPETASLRTQLTVKQQMKSRRERTLKDMRRRSLQLVQVGIWMAGIYFILGLFPDSRPLQPLVLSTPLKVLGIIVVTYLVIRLSDLIVDRIFGALDISESTPDASQRLALRVSTFSGVAKGILSLMWISIGIAVILSIIGIQILPLLAGAGIIGIGISLASQNLIKDMINGFLVLFEDQYAVGDIIQVDDVSGLVEFISLRITQIRSADGRLITIPNSAIAIVENLSKDWSRVDLSIVISYDADVDRAIHLIEKVGKDLSTDPDWYTKILEPPQVLGVEDFSNAGITLRIWIKTQPLQPAVVGREFRRRVKQALDGAGISIGIPQQVFSVREAFQDDPFDSPNRPDKAEQ
jgi:small-conductance mechanosensitive channel